ncbi:efflux RND transporter permease subunit [Desulfovibrio inopinatus]|uniref:efflux RND transporter permease subunit n=1 Tax=Desulfovibrio inopinatus TaxID=102109 RepID=UPI000425B278|nr:efflux RND transporter permease subunit [Desulfovibrio inopinatus]
MADHAEDPRGFIAGIVRAFLEPRLSIVFLLLALGLGTSALILTPREEEPQIVVPLADVVVSAPGANAAEVERLVVTPLERLLWQIDGVEYVYSAARPDAAVVTVRFKVGENREDSILKVHNAIMMHLDIVPPIVSNWFVKPVEIDDVPIVAFTLSSTRYSGFELRRMAEELYARLSETEDISRLYLIGGQSREVRVEIDPDRLTGYGLTVAAVIDAVESADMAVRAGNAFVDNASLSVVANSFLASADEVGDIVVGVNDSRPIHLSDIAEIIDGPAEPTTYSRVGISNRLAAAIQADHPGPASAVTLALAKKKGTNAVTVADTILARLHDFQSSVLPDDVDVTVIRNQGQTAQAKVTELLASLAFALVTVIALLAVTMGWREALVVAVAVPVSFSLALFVNMLFGYTINRVTLFALILSLGLVVDDPIINVDNIQRHILAGRLPPRRATQYAVAEVLPPVIMSTLTIIVSFLPLFFISGMMGPYMAPMAANVPLTVSFSTVCALTIVPWLACTLLKGKAPKPGTASEATDVFKEPAFIGAVYRRITGPFLESRFLRYGLVVLVLLLLAGSALLAVTRQVPLKMLPFDNKNEFQIVIDMPEGTTLETTNRVVSAFETYLQTVPEVENYASYVGTSSPMDFNGMVRQYYFRKAPHQADIRVNLVEKDRRTMQSHGIVLRLRRDLEGIAKKYGAALKLVESPPGPPVVSTIVAEVYGAPDTPLELLEAAAVRVRGIFQNEPFVVDVDDSMQAPTERIDFLLDREKAALHGVDAKDITAALKMAVGGEIPATVHERDERVPLSVKVILPLSKRTSAADISRLPINTDDGQIVPLAELGKFSKHAEDQPILHKNMRRVVYVFGEMAGRAPGEAILDMQATLAADPLPDDIRVEWAGEGEWKITLDVFRDLGIAFGAAMGGIYILLVIETASFFMPLLLMTAIPLTLIGILPGFWLLNLFFAGSIDGFADPIFFTATSMIGMIALGGIVIRNSLVLINFVDDAMAHGLALKEAVLRSGAIRLRPIVLTALTTALGAWPITLDPIFSGLAWALIFGLVASTLFSLVIIPVAYYGLRK